MGAIWKTVQALDAIQEVECQLDGLRALLRIARDNVEKPGWADNGIDYLFDNITKQLKSARCNIESDLAEYRARLNASDNSNGSQK